MALVRALKVAKESKCEPHGKEVTYYCLRDKENICEKCYKESHLEHRVESIIDTKHRLRKDIEQGKLLQQSYVKQLEEVGSTGEGKRVRRRGRRTLHQALDERKAAIIKAVETAVQDMHRKIDSHYQEFSENGNHSADEVTQALEALFRARKLGEKALESGHVGEMVRSQENLHMVIKAQMVAPPRASSEDLAKKADSLRLVHSKKDTVELAQDLIGRIAIVDESTKTFFTPRLDLV